MEPLHTLLIGIDMYIYFQLYIYVSSPLKWCNEILDDAIGINLNEAVKYLMIEWYQFGLHYGGEVFDIAICI
jgi:hypothetical protein